MRSRWAFAAGVVLAAAGASRAQPLPPPAGAGQLPPLLPPPAAPGGPLAEVPRTGPPPAVEYDPGYLYLPEREPERPRRAAGCGPDGRWWFAPSFELAWAPRSAPPAAVRTRVGDPVSLGGTLPGPVVPVGGRSTGRFDAALNLVLGRWFGDGNTDGVEGGLFLRGSDDTFGASAPGALVLFPDGRGRGVPQVVVFPNALTVPLAGTFPFTLSTFYLTADVNYRRNLFCDDRSRLDALVGYRFAYLHDELYFGEFADDGDDYKRNRVSVSNPFHGGQVGLAGEYRGDGGWYAAGSAKVAFGVVTPEVTATGLFAAAEGRVGDGFRRLRALNAPAESEFAVMPVLNLTVGRQVGARSRVFGGYTFQYLSRVGRIGDALSPAAGGLTFTDFWVQSVGLGFEVRY